jgi:hypothetical protein
MQKKLKKSWRHFKRSAPGKRFKQRYYERQRSARGTFRRIFFGGMGALALLTGLFFLVAPGPGTVLLLIGASLIAEESLLAARALDWAELQLRSGYATKFVLAIGALGMLFLAFVFVIL